MIRQERSFISFIPEDAHDLEKVDDTFIWIDLLEIVQSVFDVPHVDLLHLPALQQVPQEIRLSLVDVGRETANPRAQLWRFPLPSSSHKRLRHSVVFSISSCQIKLAHNFACPPVPLCIAPIGDDVVLLAKRSEIDLGTVMSLEVGLHSVAPARYLSEI